jgi:hypothetical protein
MHCPHCHASDLVFDLASDDRIYLSFWTCPGCGRRGILRMIERAPAEPWAAAHRVPGTSGAKGRLVRPAHPPRGDGAARPLRHRWA